MRSILVPVDGSPFAERALPLAIELAQQWEACVHVVSVFEPIAPMNPEALAGFERNINPLLRQNSHDYLEALTKRLRGDTSVTIKASVVDGFPAEAVAAAAEQRQIDLVVMTTHGRGAFARAWLGSVADRLVRQLTKPILLIRPNVKDADKKWPHPAFRRIMIPLDGSALAEQVIENAVALGVPGSTEYLLARVIKPTVIGNYDAEDADLAAKLDSVILKELHVLHEEDRQKATQYLTMVAERFAAARFAVQIKVLVGDGPAGAILEEMNSWKADLVALATHGRTGLPRLFLGSVADKLLRGAPVPVLLRRPARA